MIFCAKEIMITASYLSIPIIPLTSIDLIRADEDAIGKFGEDYKAYMKRVPGANFLLGIIAS